MGLPFHFIHRRRRTRRSLRIPLHTKTLLSRAHHPTHTPIYFSHGEGARMKNTSIAPRRSQRISLMENSMTISLVSEPERSVTVQR